MTKHNKKGVQKPRHKNKSQNLHPFDIPDTIFITSKNIVQQNEVLGIVNKVVPTHHDTYSSANSTLNHIRAPSSINCTQHDDHDTITTIHHNCSQSSDDEMASTQQNQEIGGITIPMFYDSYSNTNDIISTTNHDNNCSQSSDDEMTSTQQIPAVVVQICTDDNTLQTHSSVMESSQYDNKKIGVVSICTDDNTQNLHHNHCGSSVPTSDKMRFSTEKKTSVPLLLEQHTLDKMRRTMNYGKHMLLKPNSNKDGNDHDEDITKIEFIAELLEILQKFESSKHNSDELIKLLNKHFGKVMQSNIPTIDTINTSICDVGKLYRKVYYCPTHECIVENKTCHKCNENTKCKFYVRSLIEWITSLVEAVGMKTLQNSFIKKRKGNIGDSIDSKEYERITEGWEQNDDKHLSFTIGAGADGGSRSCFHHWPLFVFINELVILERFCYSCVGLIAYSIYNVPLHLLFQFFVEELIKLDKGVMVKTKNEEFLLKVSSMLCCFIINIKR